MGISQIGSTTTLYPVSSLTLTGSTTQSRCTTATVSDTGKIAKSSACTTSSATVLYGSSQSVAKVIVSSTALSSCSTPTSCKTVISCKTPSSCKTITSCETPSSCRTISSCTTPSASITQYPADRHTGYLTTEQLIEIPYWDAIGYREIHAADFLSQELYEFYKDIIYISDFEAEHSGKYSFIFNEIEINVEKDRNIKEQSEKEEKKRELNPGQAYFHEVGHAMDDFMSDWGTISNKSKYDFYGALKKDFENAINRVIRYSKPQRKFDSIVDDIINRGIDCGLEDIICGFGVKNGYDVESKFKYCHRNKDNSVDTEYYTKENIQKEAFAHFFEAGMDCDTSRMDKIKEYFPTAVEIYHKMIRDAIYE